MLEALERHLPASTARRCRRGHHVWLQLQRPLDERALYREAVRAA